MARGVRRARPSARPSRRHPARPRSPGGGPRIPLHVGVRQPVEQVLQVARGEDGIAGAPEQQGRDVGATRPGRRPRRPARSGSGGRASSGMSATKSPTARRRPGRAYGRRERPRTAAGTAGRERAAAPRTKVGVRTHTSSRSARDRASRISAGWRGRGRWCTAGVGQHNPASLVAVRQGPAERDRAAPVVGDQRPPGRRRQGRSSGRRGRRSARPASAARR